MFRSNDLRSIRNIIPLAAVAIAAGCAKPQVAAEPEPAAPATEMVTKEVVLDAEMLFDFDSDELTSEGQAALDNLVSEAGGAAAGPITVTGHTDRIGSEEYNLDLSERRANTVADYLTQQGVPAGSVSTAGRGESEPVVQCEDQAWNALVACLAPNRRVEVEFPTTVEEEMVIEE